MAQQDPSISRQQLRHLSHEAILEEVGPSRLGFYTVIAILVALFAGVVWTHFFTVTTATRTTGEVIPSGEERVLQHLEGGIVREILVDNGDVVKEGQTLLRFDPTSRGAELDQILVRRAGLSVKAARLRAFVDNQKPDFGEFSQSYPSLVSDAAFTLRATRERIEGQKAVLESQMKQRRKTVEIQMKKAQSLLEQVKLLKEAVTMREKLFQSGHGSRVSLINAKLEYARVLESKMEAASSAEQAEASIQETQNEILEINVSERGRAIEELSNTLAELAEVREQVKRIQDKVTRLDIVAPVSGIVHGFQVNTPGAVVEPAQPLVSIVPMDEQVVIEAKLAPKDIGHVQVGQASKVSIRGFDVRRYGTIGGELVRVSPSTFSDPDGTTYFKARVVLDTDIIEGQTTQHRVVPGMAVDIDITTGEMSLLEYLVRPVYASLVKSFSER